MIWQEIKLLACSSTFVGTLARVWKCNGIGSGDQDVYGGTIFTINILMMVAVG